MKPSLRDNKIDILDKFDRPDNSLLAAERNITTVSTQALFLMNNPQMIAMCKEMAADIWKRNMMMGKTMPSLLHRNNIYHVFNTILGRPPSEAEHEKAMAFYLKGTEAAETKKKNEIMEKNLASLIQILICTGEFRNVL